MDGERESEEKPTQKPDLRWRLLLSFLVLLLLVLIIDFRVFLVRWPTKGPSWSGLTVGKSTTEDVIATLGEPSKTTVGLTGTVYYYELGESLAYPTIYFRNDQVIRIRVYNEQNATLFDFVDRYGSPDYITDEVMLDIENSPKGVYWSDEGIYVT